MLLTFVVCFKVNSVPLLRQKDSSENWVFILTINRAPCTFFFVFNGIIVGNYFVITNL